MSNLIYGIHAVSSLVESKQAEEVIVLKSNTKVNISESLAQIVEQAREFDIKVTFITEMKSLPNRLPKSATHQNIFALESSSAQRTYTENDIVSLLPTDKNAFVLVLDSVQDPHNFGACIRTAHSAGVDFIVIPKDNSAPLNATVKKVACGAAEHTKVVIATNLARAIEKLKKEGVWVIGLAGEATDELYDMNLKDSIAIVAGAEGKGMRQLTKSSCDFLAKLPMYGKVSSLNVSVATGISLYEAVRQRK